MPVEATKPARQRLHGALTQIQRATEAAGEALDRHPALCVVILLLCVCVPTFLKARYTLFTCDEVYTLRIATLPSARDVLSVSRLIDLHPPLHYFAERAALHLPLPRLIAARMPSLLATAGTFLLCWAFIRRAAGSLAGLAAAVVLLFTPALSFAWLNRPYALWLFFLALLAFCWQRAREPQSSRWWLIGVFLATSGMLLDYMAGLLCILPFLAADLISAVYWGRRTGQSIRQQLNLPLLLALLVPCGISLYSLRQVHDFATNTFAPQYLDWSGVTLDSYVDLLLVPAGVIAASLAVTRLLTRNQPRRPPPPPPPSTAQHSLWILGVGLLSLPLLFGLLAALRHTQFFTRYAACGAIGVAVLAGALAPRLSRSLPATAFLLTLSLLIAAMLACNDAPFNPTGPWRAAAAQGVPPLSLTALDPTQPLVVARAVGFTEMNEREPGSLLARTYYLYDRAAAQQYSGSTIFETIATTASVLHYQAQTAPLHPFLAQHRSFYLVANYIHPEEWLPRYLAASGAHLRYLGKFSSTYEDDDLYFVTLP